MAPIKSSLARTAARLLGLSNQRDLSLRGAKSTTRFFDSNKLEATGGTNVPAGIEPGNGYKYHVFTSPGTFSVTGGTGPVEYLIVGGGGAGGPGHGGGGGAGGLRTNAPEPSPRKGDAIEVGPGTYAIVVGEATPPGRQPAPEGVGHPSSFNSIVAAGGGVGGYPDSSSWPIKSGGSGGGADTSQVQSSGGTNASKVGSIGNTPPVSPPQGNDGGWGPGGYSPGGGYGGGGGGGAGAPGGAQAANVAGSGGDGLPVPAFAAPLVLPGIPSPGQSAFNTAVGPTGIYAGGGGGGGYGGVSTRGTGGAGGGGDGGATGGADGVSGVEFTGGGGGSSTSSGPQDGQSRSEGSGATGIVIIRYSV